MKEYEEKKYEFWRENLESTLMTYLKRNLLSKAVEAPGSGKQQGFGDEEKTSLDDIDGAGSLAIAMQGLLSSF